jgi:pimeloyl-ACP methyl ester carboxylesterase
VSSVAAHRAPLFGCKGMDKTNVSRIANCALIAFLVIGVVACAHHSAAEGDGRAVVRRIPGPAGALVVDDGGRGGVPVVFLHSYAGSRAHWSHQLAHLRKTRRAIAIDLRGHGESSRPANLAYASTALAADVAAVVDALRLDRFVLVGHSMGGSAAIVYAGANPQRVAGLVLAGAPGKIPPEQASRIIASIEADYDNVMAKYWDELLTNARPDVRTQLLRERQSVGKADSIAIIRSLFADDPLPPLGRYPGPTLIIVTDGDDQPVDLHRLLPQLPTARIEGTSHWPHLDKPDAFDAVLDRFLATVR